ncbi:GYF domain-containing protein [Melittangium boletus]|uniref:GYF domain-containing protein n=1 Tax=Melittangium boletus TaxID=83453 RepID=UPI003DA312DD
MNFSCNKCQRRYSIADDKVRGKTVKVRCKNCQNVISVEGPPAEMEESTRVVSLADVERLREQDRSLAEEEAAVQSAQVGGWEDEPTRAMPAAEVAAAWFVMIKSKQEGPLDEPALRALVVEGTISARSYFWQQGMADWKRGQDVPALEPLFVAEEPVAAPVAAPPPMMVAPEPEPEPAPTARSSTSWQPEPAPPSQTTWSTEPEPEPAARGASASTPWESEPEPAPAASAESSAPSAQLGELFSDLDLPQSNPDEDGGERPLVDPGADDERTPLPEPVAAKAGRSANKPVAARRSPALKVALVLVLLVLLPVVLVVALTETQVIPLRVTRVDAQGRATQESVSLFSPEGPGALRDLVTGGGASPPAAPRPAAPPKSATPAPEPTAPTDAAPGEAPTGETAGAAGTEAVEDDELAALGTSDAAPSGESAAGEAAAPSGPVKGPPQADVARVVDASRPSFKPCIDQALRKNPKLKNGKLLLITTVASSGEVKQVAFDRPDIGASPSGECFNERARELVFPAFSGEDVEVEIPLVLKSR